MPLSSKAASTASELPPAAEDWILVAQRNALFDGIIRGDSLSLLIKFADNLFGSRAKAMTALEQAELEIYAKIKNKADNAQLKKLVERVRELEKKQKGKQHTSRYRGREQKLQRATSLTHSQMRRTEKRPEMMRPRTERWSQFTRKLEHRARLFLTLATLTMTCQLRL